MFSATYSSEYPISSLGSAFVNGLGVALVCFGYVWILRFILGFAVYGIIWVLNWIIAGLKKD